MEDILKVIERSTFSKVFLHTWVPTEPWNRYPSDIFYWQSYRFIHQNITNDNIKEIGTRYRHETNIWSTRRSSSGGVFTSLMQCTLFPSSRFVFSLDFPDKVLTKELQKSIKCCTFFPSLVFSTGFYSNGLTRRILMMYIQGGVFKINHWCECSPHFSFVSTNWTIYSTIWLVYSTTMHNYSTTIQNYKHNST